MSNANMTLVFDGSAVENGEIDVQDLAPALLAMGNLIQSANSTINGDKAHIQVKVKATSEGSFEVDLALAQSILETTKGFFDFAAANKDGITAANDLVDLIFKVIGGSGIGGGLLFLIKWLKGRAPDKIETSGNQTLVHIGDTYFITSPDTIKLAESVEVRENAKRAISCLEKDGISKFKVKRDGEETLIIEKNDTSYFEIPSITDTELQDETRNVTLQIISLSFKEENKWRVTDGSEPFNVDILDEEFLTKIANNEISFSKNDYLMCQVREKQFQTSKGLRKERSIIKVLEHRPALKQMKLL